MKEDKFIETVELALHGYKRYVALRDRYSLVEQIHVEEELVDMYEFLAVELRKHSNIGYYRDKPIRDYKWKYDQNVDDGLKYEKIKEGVHKLTFKRILPKKDHYLHQRRQQAADYLERTLYGQAEKLLRAIDVNKKEKKMFIFVHYEEVEQLIRDYDNIETKKIIDIVAPFFVDDDNPNLLDTHYTILNGEPHTELYVTSIKEGVKLLMSLYQLEGELNDY
ncbi:hypothetical protein M2146_001047 [Lachnospiraceae bacterium PF1-22]